MLSFRLFAWEMAWSRRDSLLLRGTRSHNIPPDYQTDSSLYSELPIDDDDAPVVNGDRLKVMRCKEG